MPIQLRVRDADGNVQTLDLGTLQVNGSSVSSANPMPVGADALGVQADAAWDGSGDGTLVALLKALWTQLNGPLQTHPGVITITQTVVNVTDSDTQIVAANPDRKYLAIANVNTALISLGFGAAVTAGQGWPLSAAAVPGDQGGALIWESNGITQQAIHGICASGESTSVVVLEGV